MKKIWLLAFTVLISAVSFSQSESAFKEGEWFRFRMSYSNFLKAGNATLTVNQSSIGGKSV
ncbi:MAG: DUF3108 domain-containing protein, partial [Flavobacteriaceae bacterium]|nr:DUF3108 domain-containing protein [Flavobacteriaceae bacterium]